MSYNKKTAVFISIATLIILSTPLVQPLIIHILNKDCPLVGDAKECGLTIGYNNAFYAELIPVLWFLVGLVFLLLGLANLYVSRKKS